MDTERNELAWNGRGRMANMINELQRQKESRVDVVAGVKTLEFVPGDKCVKVVGVNDEAREWIPEPVVIADKALAQIAIKTRNMVHAPAMGYHKHLVVPATPVKFLRELAQTQPGIAANLLNDLHSVGKERRFLRILDGRLRAWLSDTYKPIDNYDIAFAAMDVARKVGGEVVECRLTESNMRIAFTTREVSDQIITHQTDITNPLKAGQISNHEWLKLTNLQWGDYNPPGGTVHPIVSVGNSETGQGGAFASRGVLTAACINMAIISREISKVHLGAKMEEGVFSQETITAVGKGVMLQIRDVIRKTFDAEWFADLVAKMQEQADHGLEYPVRAITNVCTEAALSEQERDAILTHFTIVGDQTKHGVGQAISRRAQDVSDVELANFLEDLAGKVLVGATEVSEKEMK